MDTPKIHVLTIMWTMKIPLTQENITTIAEIVGYEDTPQSLRSRMSELERDGYLYRIDRCGTSRHNRRCWRWYLTKKGYDYVQDIFDMAKQNARKHHA